VPAFFGHCEMVLRSNLHLLPIQTRLPRFARNDGKGLVLV
jgi:hypothetical protein